MADLRSHKKTSYDPFETGSQPDLSPRTRVGSVSHLVLWWKVRHLLILWHDVSITLKTPKLAFSIDFQIGNRWRPKSEWNTARHFNLTSTVQNKILNISIFDLIKAQRLWIWTKMKNVRKLENFKWYRGERRSISFEVRLTENSDYFRVVSSFTIDKT